MPVRGTGPNGAVNLTDIVRYQNSQPNADALREENRVAASLIHDPSPEIRALDARLARRGVDPGMPAVAPPTSARPSAPADGAVDGDRIRRLMAMTPDERVTFFRQEQENNTVSDGPPKGSVLSGREYAPDNVPIEDMTPEQRRLSTYTPGAASSGGAPRAVRGGRFVIDSRARDGDGAPVPRAPDYNAVAEGRNSTRQKAAAYGIDVTKYDPENPGDVAALETDVDREEQRHHRLTNSATGLYETKELARGGHRYIPNERGRKMVADKNREMRLNQEWDRYSREAGEAGMTYDDFAKAYDEGGNAGLRSVTQSLRAQQRKDRFANVRQRAENANMAQLHGTTPGHVAAYNELQNAAASGDPLRLQAALFGMGNMYPGSGLGNAGVMVGQQHTDRETARMVAEGRDPKKTPMQRATEDLQVANGMPFGPMRLASYGMNYDSSLPQGTPSNPLARNQHIVNNGADGAREVANNPDRTPEAMDGLRQWTQAHAASGVSGDKTRVYRDWARRLNLPPDDPSSMKLYSDLTNVNPRTHYQYWSSGQALTDLGTFLGAGQPAPSAQAAPPARPSRKPSAPAPKGHPGH